MEKTKKKIKGKDIAKKIGLYILLVLMILSVLTMAFSALAS